MPSRMMHFCIASEILKSVDLNRNAFILGNLAPDAHDGTRAGNFISHFKIEHREYPVYDIAAFKSKYISGEINEFLLGYYLHLIVDGEWSKAFFYEYLQCSEDERNKRISLLGGDYSIFNRTLQEDFNLDEVMLEVPGQLPVYEIGVEKLKYIVGRLHSDFIRNPDREELLVLKNKFAVDFINYSVKECIDEIQGLRSTAAK